MRESKSEGEALKAKGGEPDNSFKKCVSTDQLDHKDPDGQGGVSVMGDTKSSRREGRDGTPRTE